ncbi:type II secretion system F family protein [Zoogloea sp. LCSB751]|uniref:type II secretion system F family protein n=1 Tax=Zoogloea sp. LCSB751 TaxID=1965277 RepID=UPI0009A51C3B|nr:type II secretion system F family protein [Zoogloea sp. LCSB751]
MTDFAYRAVNAHGQRVRGQLQAADLVDLEQRLRDLDLDLLHGKPVTASHWLHRQRPISRRELIKLCFHLEQFLRAGVPIIESLTDLRDAIHHPPFRQVIADTIQAIEGGLTLSEALARHPRVFDPVFCNLIRAGELSGRLPDILRSLSEALKRDDELASHSRRLAIYPAIVTVVILAALGVALLYVVPELARLFHSTGRPLPWQTRQLILLSGLLADYGWLLAVAVPTSALGARMAVRRHAGLRLRFDAALLRLPIIGAILNKIILARFTGLFAMMYASGITIIDALKTAEDVVGNTALQHGLQQVGRAIEDGRQVSEAFLAVDLFPPMVTRMLRIGENTGAIDTALANVSYFYDRDVREAIERLQASIEPLLTLVLGALLLGVMSAILMPVYDIITHMPL